MKDASTPRAVPTHVGAAVLSVLIIPLNYVVWAVASSSKGNALTLWLGAFSLLVLVQVSAGVAAIPSSLQHRRLEGVRPAVEAALRQLGDVRRPTAVSADKALLVSVALSTRGVSASALSAQCGRFPSSRPARSWSCGSRPRRARSRSSPCRARLGTRHSKLDPSRFCAT